RDDGLDAAPAQVGAVAGGGVGLVAHGAAGPAAGPPLPAARDPDRVHHRDEPRGVAVLARAGQPGDRPAAPVSGQVNLGGQPAAGAAQRLPAGPGSAGILVIRRCPLWGHRRPGRGGPRPRADGPGPRSSPRSPSSRCPRPHRSPPAAGPGSSPTSRPATSGDAARRRSSCSRTHPAGSPTGSPPGDRSPGARDANAPAIPASAAPIPHPAGHDDSGAHSPNMIYTSPTLRSTRHALGRLGLPAVEEAFESKVEAVLGTVGHVRELGVKDDPRDVRMSASLYEALEVRGVGVHPFLHTDARSADGFLFSELAD